MRCYSSRRGQIFNDLLVNNLIGAKSYDRIAGYFSSSILEIAGELLEKVEGKVRIVCNSDLEVNDVITAKLASKAMQNEWYNFHCEELPIKDEYLLRLYTFLKSGKLEVRVLPKEKFGLEHGKAGVFTLADGSRTSFLGSVNASYAGWNNNYELVWEDDSENTVNWVQEEFNALWNSDFAVPLADCVIEDIQRIIKRKVVDIDKWKEENNGTPASVIVESPINCNGFGLWEHQKFFIDLVFRDHKKSFGARYVLADEVGLGKTIQLAISAELMALYGENPILIIVPKTLLMQWQNELWNLMGIPSAVWNGKQWIDENGVSYYLPVSKSPRKIGIISQGVLVNTSESCNYLKQELLGVNYECVIVDEAHRARRKNLSKSQLFKKPEMNNLYEFLMQISKKTHSMLLATATPVQLYNVEAFDLLNILSQKNDSVLGSRNSNWRCSPFWICKGLNYITGKENSDNLDINEQWEWLANPLPYDENDNNFKWIRNETNMQEDGFVCNKAYSSFKNVYKRRIDKILKNFFKEQNPYIRHIVRRTRSFLEHSINTKTNMPYLEEIKVELFGEKKNDSIALEGRFRQGYILAENFCKRLQKRCPNAGLLKTLLLRRIGSSLIAGLKTGQNLLNVWNCVESDFDEEVDEDIDFVSEKLSDLTKEETEDLIAFVNCLETANENSDRKYECCFKILNEGVRRDDGSNTVPWKNLGCIIFSQFYDTVLWVSEKLSKDMNEAIGVYAGGNKSCLFVKGEKQICSREDIKEKVKNHELNILVGTDAASEGLNLQSMGSLINFDLPWNPTRLEQRKGRIQRIGQKRNVVYIYNMRYKDSVEDRVHELLSERLKNIYDMFGQLPDILEDVWVDVAVGDMEKAKERIDSVPKEHPFLKKYRENVKPLNWESCSTVLNKEDIKKKLLQQW